MGTDKARLVRPGEIEPLLERTCRLVHEATGTAPLVAGRVRPNDWQGSKQVRFAPDETPDAGPLAGLNTGLQFAAAEAWEAVLLLPCDLPFLTLEAISWLLNAAEAEMADSNGVIARQREQIEPLFAVYRTAACLPLIEARLATGQRSLLRGITAGGFAFADLPTALDSALRDADTPEDWEAGPQSTVR